MLVSYINQVTSISPGSGEIMGNLLSRVGVAFLAGTTNPSKRSWKVGLFFFLVLYVERKCVI